MPRRTMARIRETNLERRRTSSAYRARLDKGFAFVIAWLQDRDFGVVQGLEMASFDVLVLDQMLADFVNQMWTDDSKCGWSSTEF